MGSPTRRRLGRRIAAAIGSIVGPGVTPSTAPGVTLALGAGVTPGLHDYAVSYVTAAGESFVGPRATINVTGLLAPPAVAPTATAQAGGNGPEAGGHYYAMTFVTASGETAASPQQPYTQASIAAGTTPIRDSGRCLAKRVVPGARPGDTVALRVRTAPPPVNAGSGVDPPKRSGPPRPGLAAVAGIRRLRSEGGRGRTGAGFRYTVPYSSGAKR